MDLRLKYIVDVNNIRPEHNHQVFRGERELVSSSVSHHEARSPRTDRLKSGSQICSCILLMFQEALASQSSPCNGLK